MIRRTSQMLVRTMCATSRSVLVGILISSMMLLPVRVIADPYSINLEPGRAGHAFGMYTFPAVLQGNDPQQLSVWGSPLQLGNPVLVEGDLGDSGGVGLFSHSTLGIELDPSGTEPYTLWDMTSGERALVSPSGFVEGWTADGGTVQQSVIVDAARAGHQLVLMQTDGALTLASPASHFVPVESSPFSNGLDRFAMTAPRSPGQDFRLMDLTTGEVAPWGADNTAIVSWAPANDQPPVVPVTVLLPPDQVGFRFTVHTLYNGGAEQLQPSIATVGDTAWDAGTQLAARITATVGHGAQFWVTRDFDGAVFPTFGQLTLDPAQNTANGDQVISAQFETVPRQYQVFWLSGDYVDNLPTVQQAGGNVYMSLGTQFGAIPDLDEQGNDHSFHYFEAIAEILPGQDFWVIDSGSGTPLTANGNETIVYNGWQAIGGRPKSQPVQSEYEFTMVLDGSFEDAAMSLEAPDGSTHGFETSNGKWVLDWYFDPWHFDFYQAWTVTVGVKVSLAPPPAGGWQTGWRLRNDDVPNRPLVTSVSPGANDLRLWKRIPQPVGLQISLTRWHHDLRLRCADGSEFPITRGNAQGVITVDDTAINQARFSTALCFEATSFISPGAEFWVWDEDLQEESPRTTDLRAWHDLESPAIIDTGWIGASVSSIRGSPAEQAPAESVEIGFQFNSDEINEVVIERRNNGGDNAWEDAGRYPMNNVVALKLYKWHDTNIWKSGTYSYRMRALLVDGVSGKVRKSAYSSVWSLAVTLVDADGDGMADKWERLWNLDPTNAADAQSWINGLGESAAQMAAAGVLPVSQGVPAASAWKSKRRVKLYQRTEFDFDEQPAYDILTWDVPDKVTGQVTIEREVEEEKWVAVHTASVTEGYARIPVDQMAWSKPGYAEKSIAQSVPEVRELYNHRLTGVVTSNESIMQLRLMVFSSSMDRWQPAFPPFPGYDALPDNIPLRHYRNSRYDWDVLGETEDTSGFVSVTLENHTGKYSSSDDDQPMLDIERWSLDGLPAPANGTNELDLTPRVFRRSGAAGAIPLDAAGVGSTHEVRISLAEDGDIWREEWNLSDEYTYESFYDDSRRMMLPNHPVSPFTAIGTKRREEPSPGWTIIETRSGPLPSRNLLKQWTVDEVVPTSALVAERSVAPTLDHVKLMRSYWWLECNDCLPSNPVMALEQEVIGEKTTLVRLVSIKPGSTPGTPTSSELVESDITEEPPAVNFDTLTPPEASRQRRVDIVPLEVVAHKRGTLNKPGVEVSRSSGEFGYETVMMENADSESSVGSQERDCIQTGNLNDYRKAHDDDLVKVVLKFPANIRIPGATLTLRDEGMEVDASRDSVESAVKTTGNSHLKFYRADGTLITNPAKDLMIPDLSNPPADRYISKIIKDGEVTIFIEGGERFGDLPRRRLDRLGGAKLTWSLQWYGKTVAAKLLIYRGGFLRFLQPRNQPGVVGTFEFRDGKGRVRNKSEGYGREFAQDDTDLGAVIHRWTAKSGKTQGNRDYRVAEAAGHTPPGWWSVTQNPLAASERQLSGKDVNDVNYVKNFGEKSESWTQAPFCRWRQDDFNNGYSLAWEYHANDAHDEKIGRPTFIEYKFRLAPIHPTNDYKRFGFLIHPDGKKDGTLGCIGIQSYADCVQVLQILKNYHSLKVKVQIN